MRLNDMDKAVLVIDMPKCCDECFALDENGDYPSCVITQKQQGYTFKTREQRMENCPLKTFKERNEYIEDVIFQLNCIKEHLKFIYKTADKSVDFDMEVIDTCISNLKKYHGGIEH